MSASDDAAIIAALLWDKPTLLRSTAPGARAFAEALGAPPYRDEGETEEAPLFIAARAIRLEVAGQAEEALQQYARLDAIEGWPSVLAGFLVAWSAVPVDPSLIDGVVKATRELGIEDDELRARLLVKLATYALDKGRGDLFAELLNEAAEAAPVGSYLRRAVRISRANLLGTRLEEEDFGMPPESDPLVDYPWIDDLALGAARSEISGLLKSRASSPWSWSIRSGRTPLDEVLAAERQVTWAGALWLRDPIRQQLAAQALNDSSRDTYRTLYGLTMWVLAGGDDIGQIIDFGEPRFEVGTADSLVAQVEAQVVVPRVRDFVLPKVAVALWDLLSVEAIDRLLAQLRPTHGPVARDPEVRHFWGRAALVAPEVWQRRAQELEPPQLASLLESLPPAVIESLDRALAGGFAAAAKQADEGLSPAARSASVLIRRKLGEEVALGGVAGAERVAAEVALRDAEALPAAEYEEAERLLREKRTQEAESARQGSMDLGGRSTAADISLVAQARCAVEVETVQELVSEASDERLPADFRLDSLMALSQLASVGLATPDVPPLAEPAYPHPFSFFMSVSIDLLRAARLAVRSQRLEPDEQIAILTLSRHPDARVRQIVCAAAGMFLAAHESAAIEAALLAGLYDPDESVLTSALSALERATLTDISIDAVAQRLTRLYQEYGRAVRAATVRAAKVRLRANDDPLLVQIVESGAHDRSWLVRAAATEEDAKA